MSFCCQSGTALSSGEAFSEAVRAADRIPQVVAIGVNCTRPEFVPALVRTMKRASSKPIIAYPNSGERYDAQSKTWQERDAAPSFANLAKDWIEAGAVIVGGCCRTTPEDIARLSKWQDAESR